MISDNILYDERLDQEALQSLYEGDYEHAAIVFGQFVKSAPVQMAGIHSSFTDNQIDTFRERIHKLKPVFNFVGLTQLSNKAEALENKCKTIASINELEADYNDLKAAFAESLPIVEKVLQKLQNEI